MQKNNSIAISVQVSLVAEEIIIRFDLLNSNLKNGST